MQIGVLKRPSSLFTRLKRGVDYKERMAVEQERRLTRRGGDRRVLVQLVRALLDKSQLTVVGFPM